MVPSFGNFEEGWGAELKCPSCGGNKLFYTPLEIWERFEDAEFGLHLVIEGVQTTIDNNVTHNPSPRGRGLTIHFTCEGCSAMTVLTFAHHKGKTYVDFIRIQDVGLKDR